MVAESWRGERKRKEDAPSCAGQLECDGAFHRSWGPEGEPGVRKGCIVHKNIYNNNDSEYFLSATNAAHTWLSLVLYKYGVIFYTKNKIGTNFTRILQNKGTEAWSFICLLVHTPLTDTKVEIPSQAFKSRAWIQALCNMDALFHLGWNKDLLGGKGWGWDSLLGWQTVLNPVQSAKRCLVPLYIF